MGSKFISCILSTEYLPPISSFWLMHKAANTRVEMSENYQKKSTRNRAKILGVNGVDVLSVPLKKGKNNNTPIKEVEISYDADWVANHLHSIKSAYGNAPYFEYYYEDIESIIKSGNSKLVDLNTALRQYFITCLDIDIEMTYTDQFIKSYDEEVVDRRYVKFDNHQISGYKPAAYNQVFEEKHGFVADLSFLDLLMCKGPESILWL